MTDMEAEDRREYGELALDEGDLDDVVDTPG